MVDNKPLPIYTKICDKCGANFFYFFGLPTYKKSDTPLRLDPVNCPACGEFQMYDFDKERKSK